MAVSRRIGSGWSITSRGPAFRWVGGLNHEQPADHVHRAAELVLARGERGELEDDRLIGRQLAPEVEAGEHDLAGAGGVIAADEAQPDALARGHGDAAGLVAAVDDDLDLADRGAVLSVGRGGGGGQGGAGQGGEREGGGGEEGCRLVHGVVPVHR
jgi:hypothetical protein